MISVHGESDDLIQVAGEIQAEFLHHVPDGGASFLAFSDGSVLECTFTRRGVWRIERIWSGASDYSRQTAMEAVGADRTDRVTLSGPTLDWVLHSTDLVQRRLPLRQVKS